MKYDAEDILCCGGCGVRAFTWEADDWEHVRYGVFCPNCPDTDLNQNDMADHVPTRDELINLE